MKNIAIIMTIILGMISYNTTGQVLSDYPHLISAMTPYSQPDTEVSNGVEKIPSNWNHMSGKEKRVYVLEFISQSTVYQLGQAEGWSCGGFSFQTSINTFGLKNHELMTPGRNYDWSQNGKWNIPVYRASTQVTLGLNPNITTDNNGHFINAVLVGPDTDEKYVEDPTKFSHWLFFEPQLNEVVKPGDFSMSVDSHITIEQWIYSDTYSINFNWARPVEFKLSEDSENASFVYPILVLENPNKPAPADTEAPVISGLTNGEFEYSNSLDFSPEVIGVPTVNDNLDPSPIVSYEDVSTQAASGLDKFNYVITRTWTATDASGNSSSAEQKFTIADTQKPVISEVEDRDFEYSTTLDVSPEAIGSPTATDNGGVETLENNDVSTQASSGLGKFNYVITRTWTATDASGNSSSAEQKFTIADTTAPVATGEENMEFEYSTTLDLSPETIGMPNWTDNGEIASVEQTDASTQVMNGTVNQVNYTITRTWEVVDGATNNGTFVQQLVVSDKTAPTGDIPANITVGEEDGVEASLTGTPENITDNSDLDVSVEYSDTVTQLGGGKTVERKWTLTDIAGNEFSKVQTITVSAPDPFYLVVSREGNNLVVKYYSKVDESITVQVMDIGSGKMLKTKAAQVTIGSNTITVPLSKSMTFNVIRIIDSNDDAVQSKFFVDFN